MADIQLVMIDDFLIDCAVSETHNFESDVTEYPVESGSDITDNVRPKPITIEMECLVSNTPIGVMQSFRQNLLPPSDDGGSTGTKPSVAAYEKLQLIRNRRKPVTIRTSLRTYENMVLKTLTIPRSGKSGDDLLFTVVFQQVEMVNNKRSIRVSTPIGNGKKKVSKAPQPIQMRFITLDLANKEWFDPDFNKWRKYFVEGLGKDMIRTVQGNTAIYGPAPEYRLFRGAFSTMPAEASARDIVDKETFAPLPLKPLPATGYKHRNIILVPLSRCVLEGFTITWNPATNEANNNRVFRPR